MHQPRHLSHEERYKAAASAFSSIAVSGGPGKLQSRGSIVTPGTPIISSVSDASQGSLSVYCHRLRRLFLVDSGADVSVYPAGTEDRRAAVSSTLRAANGTTIDAFGTRDIALCLPGLRTSHIFLLADVKRPILGTDFFRAHKLLIDISSQRLFRSAATSDGMALVEVRARPASFDRGLYGLSCPAGAAVSNPPPGTAHIDSLFSEFPTVTSAPVYDASTPQHGVCLLYTSPSPRDS